MSGGRSRLVFLALGILLAASLAAAGRSAAARLEPPRGESAWAGKDPTIDLPLVAKNSSPGALSGWTTVAGGPQRTSWTAEQVSGNLQVAWYRPIQAYIPQNVQLIAWNGLIYVSTARGLYALDAGTGAVAWRYDSDMPMGNSPTVVNGVLYVAGFDRKVHALDAMTGTPIWEFSGAQAGYDTNPLVVEGKVILGNHDGNLYALDARSGQLLWKFQAGGPIRLTAAYLNGVVFFAAEDQVAYAVTTAGALKWKSQPLPGDGIQSYWPVVARDLVTQKDLVVFSGSP
ncbi:MAG TPA: PQQ-binding-like beta-propeller repeat protein, partial [Anaerolineaceae bacterium]